MHANAQIEAPGRAPRRLLMVLLPGLDGTGKLLGHFLCQLESDMDVRIIGYPPDNPLGYEDLECWVRAKLPHDRPFAVLAESFGGPIAIRLAATPPQGMVGLVLCGTFAMNPFPRLGWARRLTFLVPIKSLPRWVRARLMWGSANPRQAPAKADRAIAGVASAVVRRRITALLTVDATESLRRIEMPVLIMHARNDRIVSSAAAAWLQAQRPDADVVEVDGPHLMLQARPSECAAAVISFAKAHDLGKRAG